MSEKNMIAKAFDALADRDDELARLRADLAAAVEALRQYADTNNWIEVEGRQTWFMRYEARRVAEDALARLEGER